MKFMRFLHHPVFSWFREIACTMSQEKFERERHRERMMFALTHCICWLFIYLHLMCGGRFFMLDFFFGKFVVCSTVVVLVTDGSHYAAK